MNVLKLLRTAKFLLYCGLFFSCGFVACVVKQAPSIDALACSKSGECVKNYGCFLVPGQGALCLSNGEGLKPFVPSKEGASEATSEGNAAELTLETAPEPALETAPEPALETAPEPPSPDASGADSILD